MIKNRNKEYQTLGRAVANHHEIIRAISNKRRRREKGDVDLTIAEEIRRTILRGGALSLCVEYRSSICYIGWAIPLEGFDFRGGDR